MKLVRKVRRSKRPTRRRSLDKRSGRFEQLEPRMLLTGLPYGAVGPDTGEYMLGDVLVTVVFFESDGSLDASSEDWNPLLRDAQGNVVLDENGQTISGLANLFFSAEDGLEGFIGRYGESIIGVAIGRCF